jgi:hypothetical protein
LLRAYALLGFGTAYPVVRALSVMLVTPAASLLSGETLSVYGVLGIGLIVVSLFLLAAGSRGHAALPRAALFWMLLAGLATAGYVLCDSQGVRRAGSPLAYGFVVSATNAAAMFAFQGVAARQWRSVVLHAGLALPIAAASTASYLLILWVWSQAPVAPASALRDTSSIFAIVIAIVWLASRSPDCACSRSFSPPPRCLCCGWPRRAPSAVSIQRPTSATGSCDLPGSAAPPRRARSAAPPVR